MSEPVVTDAEAAAIDVPALLREGLAEAGGGLRGELQGLGAVAAAVQLEGDGVVADEVALAITQLRNQAMGVEVAPVPLSDRLEAMVTAGRAADPPEDELLAQWLGLVANLLMMRARWR